MTQVPRILILTAGFGEGHNAAAHNLAAAFSSSPEPVNVQVADVFALAAPRLNAVTRRAYLEVINELPRIWSSLYSWIDRSELLPRGLWALRREIKTLATLIARERPTAICSTYPVYAFMLQHLARENTDSVRHFNIVTDSISINSLWWRADCAGWFVPNADSATILLEAGIDPARIHDCGFPTPAFFAEHVELAPPPLTNNSVPRLLYIINSGTRHAAETARLLLAKQDWDITCAVGRDEELLRQLNELAKSRSRPAQILGWTDQIPRLLMTHHLVISKAGGATTQEAIAARCPMIVNQIVPGQEEGNYELLRRRGIGMLATSPEAVISACQHAFAWDGALWGEWRAALAPLSRPNSARVIAKCVLAQSGATSTRSEAAAKPLSYHSVAQAN